MLLIKRQTVCLLSEVIIQMRIIIIYINAKLE